MVDYIENTTYDELQEGDSASSTHTVTTHDIKLFAAASGDLNPLHLDPEFAKSTDFGECIAHGMWVGSLVSALLANKLPGPGGIYLSQSLKFSRPAYVGDTLTISVTVTAKKRRNIVVFDCRVTNQNEQTVAKGECMVAVSQEKIRYPKAPIPDFESA